MGRSQDLRPGVQQGFIFHVDSYGCILLDSPEEEVAAYKAMLKLLYDQPRFFLDNLEYIKTFRVSWLNYSSKEYCDKVKRNYAISHPKGV